MLPDIYVKPHDWRNPLEHYAAAGQPTPTKYAINNKGEDVLLIWFGTQPADNSFDGIELQPSSCGNNGISIIVIEDEPEVWVRTEQGRPVRVSIAEVV